MQRSKDLLDHLVGNGKQGRWHGQAEGLRSLEIDGEFELGRSSTGKSAGFSPRRMRSTQPAAKRPVAVRTGP
jgi:hypothetical protein